MIEFFSIVIAGLAFVSAYLLTSKNLFRILLGFMLMSQAVHLFLFTRGRLVESGASFISSGQLGSMESYSDPLVQALILTAIVISFAITAFAAALFVKGDRS